MKAITNVSSKVIIIVIPGRTYNINDNKDDNIHGLLPSHIK